MPKRDIDGPAVPFGFWPSVFYGAITLCIFAAILLRIAH